MTCGVSYKVENLLGPTLANFFLGHLEKTLFENPDNKDEFSKLYLRYTDDVYAVLQSKSFCSKFLNVLNAQHKDIKFTMEKAINTLNVLDVEIKMNDTEYDTCVWRKPTNTGLLLNFHSICPTTWKSGLMKCFLHRAKYICSNYFLYKQESEKLRMLFQKNAYPNWFINKIITKFENSNFNNTNNCNFSNTQEIEKEFAFTFGIPYIGKPSHMFSKNTQNFKKKKIRYKHKYLFLFILDLLKLVIIFS